MKRLGTFTAALLLTSALTPVYAQQPVTVIGTVTPGNCVQWFSPTQIKDPGVTCNGGASTSPGGSNGQVQYNNAGTFGGLTNAQLTALINPAGSNGQVQYNNAGSYGGANIASLFDSAFCNTVRAIDARTTGAWVCSSAIPINAVWLGAVGNNSTDNAATFQTIANLANSTGSSVFLPEGI